MGKMRLDPEALQVDSFSTDPEAAGGRRTVHGHDDVTNEPRTSCAGGPFCTCPVSGVNCVRDEE